MSIFFRRNNLPGRCLLYHCAQSYQHVRRIFCFRKSLPKLNDAYLIMWVMTTKLGIITLKLCRNETLPGWTLFFNTLRPRHNGRYFADDIFKCIFVNEKVWISLKILLNFVAMVQISNIPALVQIMAWRRPGDRPLPESMMISLPTYICVTRPLWV